MLFTIYYKVLTSINISKYQKNKGQIKYIVIFIDPPYGYGDCIMSFPFIERVLKIFPDKKIILFTHFSDITQKIYGKHLNLTIINTNTFSLLSYLRHLKAFKAQKSISSESILIILPVISVKKFIALELASLFLGIKYRITYKPSLIPHCKEKIELISTFFREKIYFDNKREHFSFLFLKTIQFFDSQIENYFKNYTYPKYKKQISKKNLANQFTYKKKIIFLNPYVKEKTRKLKSTFFVDLLKELKILYSQFQIIMVGGKDAQQYNKILTKQLNTNNIPTIDMTGLLSKEDFIAFLNYGNLFITLDSGPFHMACLSSIKIFAIFTTVNPKYRILPKYLKSGKIKYIYILDYMKNKKKTIPCNQYAIYYFSILNTTPTTKEIVLQNKYENLIKKGANSIYNMLCK